MSSLSQKFKNAANLAWGEIMYGNSHAGLFDWITLFLTHIWIKGMRKLLFSKNRTAQALGLLLGLLLLPLLAVRGAFTLAFMTIAIPFILFVQAVFSIRLSVNKDLRTAYFKQLCKEEDLNVRSINFLIKKGVNLDGSLDILAKDSPAGTWTFARLSLMHQLLFECGVAFNSQNNCLVYVKLLTELYCANHSKKVIQNILKLLIERDKTNEVLTEILINGKQWFIDALQIAIADNEFGFAIYLILHGDLNEIKQQIPKPEKPPSLIALIYYLAESPKQEEDIQILQKLFDEKRLNIFSDPEVHIESIFNKAVCSERKEVKIWLLAAKAMQKEHEKETKNEENKNNQDSSEKKERRTPSILLPQAIKILIGKNIFSSAPFDQMKVDAHEFVKVIQPK